MNSPTAGVFFNADGWATHLLGFVALVVGAGGWGAVVKIQPAESGEEAVLALAISGEAPAPHPAARMRRTQSDGVLGTRRSVGIVPSCIKALRAQPFDGLNHASGIAERVTVSNGFEATESRSLRNGCLGLVGMSAFSTATVDNRGHIVIGSPICNACIRVESRSHRSACTNL